MSKELLLIRYTLEIALYYYVFVNIFKCKRPFIIIMFLLEELAFYIDRCDNGVLEVTNIRHVIWKTF